MAPAASSRFDRRARTLVGLFLTCGVAGLWPLACTGRLGEGKRAAIDSPAPTGEPTVPSGASSSPTAPDTPTAPTEAACSKPLDPGPVFMRRLTNNEYARTTRDLVGASRSIVRDFPPDSTVDGFDNNAEGVTLSSLHVERYRNASERLARAVTRSVELRTSVIGCDLAMGDVARCLRSFAERFGRRAFRRPLLASEIDGLLSVASAAKDDPDPYAGAMLVIEALLQSPSFLFRVETGVADPARPGLLRLTGYETATRLSYLLLGTTPSDALLDAAGRHELDTADGVEGAARAMLADPRAKEAVRSFYSQWLRLDEIRGVSRKQEDFPDWSPEARDDMEEETTRFVDDFIWRDGVSFLDVLTASYTYVNDRLATLYGLKKPEGTDWSRVELLPSDERIGLLTQGSYLVANSRLSPATAIHRGKYIREVLLCQALPPPPPTVPAIPAAKGKETDRERLERHRTDPACSGCHKLMDPLGFGLAHFDAIGAHKPTEKDGKPISQRGRLEGFEDGDFDGPIELSKRLRERPEVSSCVVTQMFRYTFGRSTAATDDCTLTKLHDSFKEAGFDFRKMVVAFVRSDPFRFRHASSERGAGGGT